MPLDAIGIVVEDMARALAFYRRLGLDFPEGAEGEGHVEAPLAGGIRLMLDTVDVIHSFDPDWEPPSGGDPRVGLAFSFETPAEVDAKYGELVDAGYDGHKEPWDAFWGQRYAQVRDPDGFIVDLFAPVGSS